MNLGKDPFDLVRLSKVPRSVDCWIGMDGLDCEVEG